jgi:hypothetical protein
MTTEDSDPKPLVVETVTTRTVTSTSSDRLPSLHDVHETGAKTEMTIKGALGELLRRLLGREALMLLLVIVAVGMGTLWVRSAFGQSLDAGIEASQAAQDSRIEAERQAQRELAARYEQHVIDSGHAHQRLESDMHEVQLDLRALYRSSRTGSREPRLEAPPTVAPTYVPYDSGIPF